MFRLIFTLLTLLSVASLHTHAAWFEASGQAVIHNNNKELARQQATHEAIRQALLFAGASVRSVQEMTDGLLQDEHLEIRASGEVASVELISEHYYDDFVEVAIRADIFPQRDQCSASDYKKNIVTSKIHVSAYRQAAIGGLNSIDGPLANAIKESFEVYSQRAMISKIEPYTFFPQPQDLKTQSMLLAEQTSAQYVLIGDIVELSLDEEPKTYLDVAKFWDEKHPGRNLSIRFMLLDGTKGDILFDKTYHRSAIWQFDKHQRVHATSKEFWGSQFGKATQEMLRELTSEIDELIACMPTYGRIIGIHNNSLSVNIGSKQGVKKGDELAVFQMRHFFSPNGLSQTQYSIHPSRVVVTEAFFNSAQLRVVDGTPLANIQPNDFVVRR
ncbi:flagella assembly protein FlgT [Planctobacterium marinum]|uniref:Flagellar protein FlgT n=1 Tax=Planctobacterium marinum TaxID=1631968 RepID=A0AA48HJ39_9ALTE|nr:hypothetical protein MACH26_33440 [Planctobacterium marinum]